MLRPSTRIFLIIPAAMKKNSMAYGPIPFNFLLFDFAFQHVGVFSHFSFVKPKEMRFHGDGIQKPHVALSFRSLSAQLAVARHLLKATGSRLLANTSFIITSLRWGVAGKKCAYLFYFFIVIVLDSNIINILF